MRWDKLFDDLESQLERELTAEELDLGAEEERLRLGRLTLRDRLVAVQVVAGAPLAVTLLDGTRLRVRPVTVGRDWVSADVVDDSPVRRQCVIPIASIAAITLPPGLIAASLGGARTDEHPALTARLGLTFVLRDLCRRRRPVQLLIQGGTVHGTIDRVGRDHLDLAVHEPGSARRDSAVEELRVIALTAVQLVRL
ncbi:MAG: hypothetical protein WA006_08765 [Rhodoglobus sp.]